MKILALSLLVLASAFTSRAAEIYVSPGGSSSGTGSKDRPLSLERALSDRSPARPGDIIWLRGGTYRGKFVSEISGTASSRITVASYPGEWARIDSGVSDNRDHILYIRGSDVTFRDFEVFSSDTKRATSITGSHPGDIRRGQGVCVDGPRTKLINLVIHDTAQGISSWAAAPDVEIYGCLIYYNGWNAPDRAHGHGIYAQNEIGSKLIENNIIFAGFEKGIQLYGSSEAELRNFTIRGNVIFNNGLLSSERSPSPNISIYGGNGPRGIVVTDNLLYGTGYGGTLDIGGEGARDLVFERNYVPHLTRIRQWETARVTGNTFIRHTSILELYRDSRSKSYLWDNNTYFGQELKYNPFGLFFERSSGSPSGQGLGWSGWLSATGYDRNSKYTRSTAPGPRVFLLPNKYENGRAHVVIYNWTGASAVSVDVSDVLSRGQTFELRNAQDYFAAPMLSGTYDGDPLRVPLTGHSVAAPIGVSRPPVTAPEFAVFVLRVTGTAPAKEAAAASPVNSAPQISAIASQKIAEDASVTVSFSISDKETGAEKLGVLASSSDPTLVPSNGLRLSGSGSSRALTIVPAANRNGSATITITVTDGTLLSKTAFALTVAAVNDRPTISSISDLTSTSGASSSPAAFTVSDVETAAASLILTASADDKSLVPDGNILFSGSGSSRSVVVKPAPGKYGSTAITVRVSDGSDSAAATFQFTSVAPVAQNTHPVISRFPDQTTYGGASTGPIPFSISDAETPASELVLYVRPSNTTLVPEGNCVISGSGGERTLTITPAAGQYGETSIYVLVTDGKKTTETGFRFHHYALSQRPNTAPTLSDLSDVTFDEDDLSPWITFRIGDAESGTDSLRVAVESSNPALINPDDALLHGAGEECQLRLRPAANCSGTAEIRVVVTDGKLSCSRTFRCQVRPVNDPPVISPIRNQATTHGAAAGPIPFTVSDPETDAAKLAVSASSSNPALVPAHGIRLEGSGNDRAVTVIPVPGQGGSATISVSVHDGETVRTTSFEFSTTPASSGENQPPSIEAPQHVTVAAGVRCAPVSITISDDQTAADELQLIARPSTTSGIAPESCVFGGKGSNRTLVFTPAPGSSGDTRIYLLVTDGKKTRETTLYVTIVPGNTAPSISSIPDLATYSGVTVSRDFVIGDAESSVDSLQLSVSSSNPDLIPEGNIVLQGNGSGREIAVTPVSNVSGIATITVTVSDGDRSDTTRFDVEVQAPQRKVSSENSYPTINPMVIGPQTVSGGESISIPITIGDAETPADELKVYLRPSDSNLVPRENAVVSGSGSRRTLNLKPAIGVYGTTKVFVLVTDGKKTTETGFWFTASK